MNVWLNITRDTNSAIGYHVDTMHMLKDDERITSYQPMWSDSVTTIIDEVFQRMGRLGPTATWYLVWVSPYCVRVMLPPMVVKKEWAIVASGLPPEIYYLLEAHLHMMRME